MARPDYLICLECESEVEDFTWRDGEVRRVTCEVCGNNDTDAFSLPDDYDQGAADEDEDVAEDEEEVEDEENDHIDDYDEDEEDDQ